MITLPIWLLAILLALAFIGVAAIGFSFWLAYINSDEDINELDEP